MSQLTVFVQNRFPGFYRWLTLRMTRERSRSQVFAPLQKPLSQCRFALVSTGGFYLDGQPPFDIRITRKDECSFRQIPADTPAEKIRIAHAHYNHAPVQKDLNIMLPVDRMRELEREGVIGGLAPIMISFMGAIRDPRKLIEETGPEAAQILKNAGADCAILTPG